jgi:hypothetical protein
LGVGVSSLPGDACRPIGDAVSDLAREPEYVGAPVEQLHPILVNVGMDVRLELRLDMRQFLREHGLDPQSGEPSPEELQAVIVERLRTYFRSHDYMVDVHVQWINDLDETHHEDL